MMKVKTWIDDYNDKDDHDDGDDETAIVSGFFRLSLNHTLCTSFQVSQIAYPHYCISIV